MRIYRRRPASGRPVPRSRRLFECDHLDTDPYCDTCVEQAQAESEDDFWYWTGGCIEPEEPIDVLAARWAV